MMPTNYPPTLDVTFNWNDLSSSKKEYDLFAALLTRKLGELEYVLTVDGCNRYRPVAPNVPEHDNATERAQHEVALAEYRENLNKFYLQFEKAKGILRNMFTFQSKASNEVNSKMSMTPAGMANIDFTPELQFRTALEHLSMNYAPRDSTDKTELRTRLLNLDDISCGGLVNYHKEFTHVLQQLRDAGHVEPEETLNATVRTHIRNADVLKVLYTSVIQPAEMTGQPVSYATLFNEGLKYLKTLSTINYDPYGSVQASVLSKPIVSANSVSSSATGSVRCTKCWRYNHRWSICTSATCSICGNAFGDSPYCTNYQVHKAKEPGTEWVLPRLLRKNQSCDGSQKPQGGNKPTQSTQTTSSLSAPTSNNYSASLTLSPTAQEAQAKYKAANKEAKLAKKAFKTR